MCARALDLGSRRSLELVRACVGRVVEVEAADRAVALASLTFTALIPLGVVVGSLSPATRDRGIVTSLVRRFKLDGQTRALLEGLFAPPADVRSTVSVIGSALVIVSALSFTRGLQRVYERSWRLPARGVRGTPAGVAWLLGLIAFFAVVSELRDGLIDGAGPALSIVLAFASAVAIWLATPYVLLARRIGWHALLPTALLTGAVTTAIGTASTVYMPGAIATSAARYGEIGVTFALVSWLVSVGFGLVICAGVGAVIAERLARDRSRPDS
ncbi:MAG: YhjD/YihY/BrkB family envelope integrity protein [Solirubrobacteraceae bacterium]